MLKVLVILATSLLATGAIAQNAEVSVALGERISIIGGCHDCHTAGYNESGGVIDPAAALKGASVGFQGPWGTTYPANLRLVSSGMSEDKWVGYLRNLKTAPPMPWYNLHHFTEEESRSLHQYIASLGDPGDPAPKNVPPGGTPQTPFIVFAPPTMPAQ
jgi:mono/diheme cytochrome c family protein